MTRAGRPSVRLTRALVLPLAALGLVSCMFFDSPVHKRSVQAQISEPATMRVGESALFEATLVYSDGSSELLTPSTIHVVVWESSNKAAADIAASYGFTATARTTRMSGPPQSARSVNST